MRPLLVASAVLVLASWLALPCRAVPMAPERVRPQQVGPAQFAFGLELASEAAGSVHVLTLPERVLRALTDHELGDVCVFDAQGHQVAQAVARDGEPERELVERPLPYFPLETRERGATGGVAVSVERDRSGAITRAFAEPEHETRARVVGYLLDVSLAGGPARFDRGAQPAPLTALTLAFGGDDAFTVQAEIEASDDLSRFSPLGSGTLARLAHDGRTLRQERIALAPTTARYLRVTLRDAPDTLTLMGVSAELDQLGPARPRRFVELTAQPLPAGEEQLFSYELRGAFQPDRYRLVLPASTALVEATLESGQRAEGPFHELDRGLFRRGADAERELPATRATFFRLRVAQKGGGVRDGAPVLALGYSPPRLLFSAEQSGPYLLAYASASARCRKFDPHQLQSLTQQELPTADTVRVLRARTLAGSAALAKPEPPRELRVYFLWAVLIAGVLLLALLARRLLRQS